MLIVTRSISYLWFRLNRQDYNPTLRSEEDMRHLWNTYALSIADCVISAMLLLLPLIEEFTKNPDFISNFRIFKIFRVDTELRLRYLQELIPIVYQNLSNLQ